MTTVQWKRIPLFAGTNGRIKLGDVLLDLPPDPNGYLRVYFLVHRLVAWAFYGKPESPSMVVHHVNGNPGDNRPDNLEWVTQSENLNSKSPAVEIAGTRRLSDLTEDEIRQIQDILLEPITTVRELAQAYEVSTTLIRDIRSGDIRTNPGMGNKLAWEEVLEIRQARIGRAKLRADLGLRFSVAVSVIRQIERMNPRSA